MPDTPDTSKTTLIPTSPADIAAKVFRSYPLGERLEYLGKVMIVVRHIQHRESHAISFGLAGTSFISGQAAELHAEYVDDNGVIREKQFISQQFRALLPTKTTSCQWKHDDGGVYETQCGEAYCFEHELKVGSSHTYCSHCGKPIVIAKEDTDAQ